MVGRSALAIAALSEDRRTISARLKEMVRHEILKIKLVKDVGFAEISRYQIVHGGSAPFEYLFDAKTAVAYIAAIYEVMHRFGTWYVASLNNFLKQTNEKVVAILRKHRLYSRGIIDERVTSNLIGRVSFRQIAVLAGLGTIGKNTCLLHPEYGANVLIGVVLTNSHIPYDEPLRRDVCQNCAICLGECPVKAITNDFFDGWKCKDRRKILKKGCGTPCILHCPAGRNKGMNE